MDDKNAQELNALEEAAFNDPVKFLNEQHAPRTWTMSTEDLARTAAVSPYEIMATSEERWGPEKASIATTAVREFVRGFAGMADSTVNGIMEDRAKEIIYRSPNMRQKDANRLIEDVMRSGSLARQVENYESSKTAHDNFTAGISNGLGSMVSLALLGWATRSPAVVGAAAGVGEAYNAREEMVDRYIQEMGTAEGLAGQLGKYNALSTGYGVFAGFVEGSIGVERLAAGALNRYGRLAAMERLARQQGKFGRALAYKTGRQVVATGLEEGGEEFLQSIGQDVAVALTRDMWENPDIKKALIQAGYGALIGSTSGGVMYNIGRKRAIDFIRRWNDENNAGLTESQIVQAADAALDDVAQPMVDEIATRTELRNQYGQAYEILKNRFRQQIESTGTTPWTDQNKSMEEYIDTLASTLTVPAVLQANGLNIPTAQFLEIADMVVQDNVLQLVPLNNATELEDIIARQTSILAQHREAKKLGMGDDTARQAAEQRKAVAQKALRNLREEERIRKQIVQEKRKADKKRLGYDEIDQAKKDTRFLKNARTLDSFKAKLEDGTTTEQAKNRLEAAFMNWIADKDKTLAEDLILYRGGMQKAVDLLTANAKVIYDTAKKHPGAGLREDIANALRKLRHTNKDNFLLVTQALARDGHDVMPENILLWHWVFADPTTNNQFLTNYTTKLAENREQVADGQALFGQKVAPLSKKDLIMQALQDTDQAKAQLAESRGRKYEPLFDKNGAVKEPYLAAAIVSYQNQFAPRFAQQMPRLFQEQFDLADENARLDEIYPEYTGDTIEVDGKVRTVYNSEGQRINKSAEALTNFWRWFGNSKAVDALGRPLVMYHGSYEKFEAFSKDTFGNNTGNLGMFGEGFYFTDEHFIGADYAGLNANREEDKGTLYTVYLKIDNPLVIDSTIEDEEDYSEGFRGLVQAMRKAKLLDKDEGWNDYNSKFWDDDRLPKFVSDYAKKHGFDGIFGYYTSNYFVDMGDTRAEFVTFEPTQIKSVNNLGYYNEQDPRMLYQPAYVSLKGELVGDYIDADLHLGRGDNTRVWLWGNYMLLNEKIDKEHYFDRFEKEGPRLTYEGKEITPKVLDELGFSNEFYVTDQIRGNLMDYAKSILYTKEDLISSTEKYLKQYEDVHKYYLKRAIDRLVRRGWDRKEVKQMVKDIEAIALGEEGWAGAALNFNKGTPEYEIQKKYRDSEGHLDDKFTELYVELSKEFDEIESQFRSYNGFIGSVRRVDAIRKALDAIKKMDWNKLGGRTGFAYKGESFTGILSQVIADTGLYEYDRNNVFYRVDEKLRRTLKEKKDVQVALKSLDEEYTKFTELVPSANKAIEETVDKYKDDYPAADPKAVVDAIEKYMVKPQTPLRGLAPSLLIFNEGNLSPADDDLLRKVAGSRESGIELPEWEYKDNKPTIADIVARIKTAETRLAILRHVQNFFKDATNADFNYKPMATMIETEAPENYELLNASRPLDRQPKQVQQAIIDTIREYAPKYPELHLEDNLYSGIGRTLNDEQARMFSKMFDIDLEVSNAFLQDEVERKVGDAELEQVPDDLWTTMYEAIDYALTMKENPKFSDIIDGLKKRRKYIEENGYFNYHKDLQQKHFIIIDYLLDQANKQPKKTPVSEFTKELSNFKGVELHDNNAFKFLDRINSYMNLNPDVYESLKKDTSLGLTQNPPSDEIIIKMFRKHGIKGLKYYGHRDKRGVVTWQKTPVTRLLYSLDFQEQPADYMWQPINPKSVMPRVRGGWTKEKILRYLKSWGSYFGAVKAVKEISNFDSVEDFKNHVFYHGARYGTSGSMSPSITMSDREVERIGGGGYGEKYWAISVTKSKRVAGNFATAMDDGRIYPILLVKNAKVIEMPELTDSADLEDHIVDLYNQGVDAVWIGDKNAGEQELAVINPRAIINIGKADFYRAFRLGSEENPIRMKTDKDFETIFEFAKDYRNKDEETRVQEAREVVYWQGRRATVRAVYDPELQTVILGKNWNELSLVHEFHHHYLKKIWDYFKQAQAGMRAVSKAWLDDTQRLFSMLEIDPNQKALTTVQQEKFAYMVEAYLTGLGVENQDNLAFQGFLHWIPEKYRSIMDLGYLDANGQIQNPMLDEESIAFFNKWFASPLVPSLPSAPDAQRIMNASDEDGEIIPSNQKVMNNREKEWAQDSEIQNKADAQLWRGIGENTPSDMRAALDGEKELMKVETNNMPDDRKLPVATKPTLREKWFKTRQPDAREMAAEAARAYLAKNPEHARALAFADPETLAEFDAPVDQGMLIRAVMETVNKGSDEWYVLDNNLAMVKSMSGSTLSLSGDLSHQAYLDAKREIEMARELKAITNYAGTGRGAAEKWNGDIRAFAARRTAAILATEPNSEERKVAIEAFLEEAKTKFSGNTTNAILNQLDLTGYQTKSSQVFIKWAEKQIKNVSHARLDAKEQAELMKASVAAQLALQDIDSKELKDGKYVRAVQSSKDIRHWQFVKDKMKKAYIGRWGKFGIFWDNLWGSYAPSAMLMSANTLFFANVPSTAINTGTIRLAALSIGENKVDKNVQNGEIKRIKQIFNASGMNIAQMDKPTSPSLLHGEKYTQQEQKHWYNFTFDILGREDNVFRVPTFVDALARIATKNANGDAKKATALFNEYTKLNTTDDEAKIARKQALAVANMAVFTQDGIMASALNHIRSSLNTMTRGALGLEPGGFGLGNILAPFLKTGANITEMGLSAALALPRTAIAIAQNKLLGKEIPDIRRIALISDWINLAWTAVVIAVLAAISGDDDDWYTEPYESGKRYDPDKPYDSIRFGNYWVKLDIFGPMAIPLRTALKVVKEWEKKKLGAVTDGLAFGGMEALSDTPLVNQFIDNQVDYMTKQPGAYWSSFGYNQLNKLVPAQVKTLTKAGSRATGIEWDAPWMGKTIDRKFHRNYGLDGERLTTNDLINIFTNRLKYKPQE
jgi:hypothetical protein